MGIGDEAGMKTVQYVERILPEILGAKDVATLVDRTERLSTGWLQNCQLQFLGITRKSRSVRRASSIRQAARLSRSRGARSGSAYSSGFPTLPELWWEACSPDER